MHPKLFFGFSPLAAFRLPFPWGRIPKRYPCAAGFPSDVFRASLHREQRHTGQGSMTSLGTPMPLVHSKNIMAHPQCSSCCPTCLEEGERERLVASGPWAGYVIPYGSNHSTSYPGNISEMIFALGGVDFARRWAVTYFLAQQRYHYGLSPPYPNHL